jgi:hypothetical protein
MNGKQWYCVSVKGLYVGKCYATEAEIRAAVGPYHTLTGNHIDVFAPCKVQA